MYNLLDNTLAVTPVIAATLIFVAIVANDPAAIDVLLTNKVPDIVPTYVLLNATGQLAFQDFEPTRTHSPASTAVPPPATPPLPEDL